MSDQRVHPEFKKGLSPTGRLSCRELARQYPPVPGGVREIFKPGPEHILVHADYTQIEFRLWAALKASGG